MSVRLHIKYSITNIDTTEKYLHPVQSINVPQTKLILLLQVQAFNWKISYGFSKECLRVYTKWRLIITMQNWISKTKAKILIVNWIIMAYNNN